MACNSSLRPGPISAGFIAKGNAIPSLQAPQLLRPVLTPVEFGRHAITSEDAAVLDFRRVQNVAVAKSVTISTTKQFGRGDLRQYVVRD